MKPINLKVQGINSYVTEQEIKFDKLAESKLFGIFGETGSGKTTILDAIVLALYGTSERETISNMINVNVKNAHVYFQFEVEVKGKNTLLEVRREYRLRDSGVKQDAKLTNMTSGKILADTTENVNANIMDLLGVGKKEFLKCIALPQGEFDNFLLDTPAGRKKTIAKLFNLEHFGVVLQEKIKMRKEMTNLKLLNTNDKLALYSGVTQEALYSTHATLNTKKKRLKEVTKALTLADKEYTKLSTDLQLMDRLIDNMAQLTIKNNEANDINLLKKQVEFTEKYGNFIMFFNKKKTFETELNHILPNLTKDKDKLAQVSEDILQLVDKLGNVQDEEKDVQAKLQVVSVLVDKYNKEQNILNSLQEERTKLVAEINALKSQIVDLTTQLQGLQSTLDEQKENRVRLQALVDENNNILDKIRDTKMVKTVDEFIDYLNYVKNIIDPHDLSEVYQYKVYSEVTRVIESMQKYELKKRHDVADLKKEYERLQKYNADLTKLQSELESKNKQLNTAIVKIDNSIESSKNVVLVTKTQIKERKNLGQTKIALCKNLDVKILASKVALKSYGDIQASVALKTKLDELTKQEEQILLDINDLTNAKNSLVVSVEVASANVENITRELRDINQALGALKVDYVDNIQSSYHLEEQQLISAKARIEEYDRSIQLLQANIDDINSKIGNRDVTKAKVAEANNQVQLLRDEQNRISVDIGVLTQSLDTLKDNLKVVKQLNKDKEKYEQELDVVTRLQALIAGGGLLEYVSEEYMGLITEFANKFVYQISKGKYLLKYNGEFYVLDNFNGGVSRGVKTLSGGERFIISLSLALGISQSISVGSKHAFNFFFIDEGFGSLSEDYIENVLNSFNELIKLDFTVGFISHVEKMQNFINNRIIVTKPNNEVGTLVKQYF